MFQQKRMHGLNLKGNLFIWNINKYMRTFRSEGSFEDKVRRNLSVKSLGLSSPLM